MDQPADSRLERQGSPFDANNVTERLISTYSTQPITNRAKLINTAFNNAEFNTIE